MIKKGDNFLEEHAGKIVFAVIGMVSLWLLWAFVFSGPYSVEYHSQKCSPSEIDAEVKQLASVLAGKLSRDPDPRSYTSNKATEFSVSFECSLKNIPDCPVILPTCLGTVQEDGARKYRLPDIGVVTDVSVEHVRSVAHVPTEPLTDKVTYKNVPTKLSDIDFITVQASFDTVALYDSFRRSFTGVRLKSQWHDDELAKPIFAAVGLQRRQIFDGTAPGEWEKVGQTKINEFAKLSELPQKITQLEYGDIDLKKAEFDKPEVQLSILQPMPYDFAVSDEQWLPPHLHKQYRKLLESELEKERKEEREKKKTERERSRTTGTSRRQPTRRPEREREARPGIGRVGEFMPGSEKYLTKRREKTSDAIVMESKKLLINERTKLGKLREPLVFWAHDDSAVAGKNYQYRIRLGVLNPIAGRNWFMEDQSHLADELVLWSSYSEPTEVVSVLRMMYFFPIAGSVENKTAEVRVAKFHMGRWMSENFSVGPGQLIGNVVEKTPVLTDNFASMYQIGGDITEEIDYTTKAVLIDVVNSSDFTNLSQKRVYTDILYTENGRDIEHLAAKSRNWPAYFRKVSSKVKGGQDREIQITQNRRDPFGSGRDRAGSQGGKLGVPGARPGMPGMGMPGMGGPGMGRPGIRPER